MSRIVVRLVAVLFALTLNLTPVAAQPVRHWLTSWATAPMAMQGDNALPAMPAGAEVTLRQSVRLSVGGDTLRVRFTNRYGTAPLRIVSAAVGRAAETGAQTSTAGTERPLRFANETGVTIPAGAEYWSDPVAFNVGSRERLTVTIRAVPDGTATGHPGARTTSFVTSSTGAAEPTKVARWYYLSAIDVTGPGGSTIAILGDSITDGYGVKENSDGRWTDYLAERLQANPATRHLAVANLGIGGNRLLLDGLGPNALARFDRDVLALSGVRHLVILIGVNDLGTLTRDAQVSADVHRALVTRMIAGYRQLVARARDAGIRVIGVPILPYGTSGYYHPDAANEADRQALDAWLRAPGNVDAVLDLDAALRDPRQPERMRADADSGDGLHPSDAGYRAMAEAVPLTLFAPARPQVVLTFDDLPLHGPLPKGETADGVARSIVATLKRHRVGEAYGFMNGAQADRDPALTAPLRTWRQAGYPLANHGWSHANLDTIGVSRFAEEVAANEAPLAALMPGNGWRYFRYPFLAEGRDPATLTGARRVLADRGYRIAPVSLDFSDWRFNQAYARCRDRQNGAAVRDLEGRFMAAASRSLADARSASVAAYGREVPQIALLHSGAFTAHMLPRLLDMYKREGVAIGTLSDALADPAYGVAARAAPGGPTDPISAPRPALDDLDRVCA